jgi:ribosomal protein L34
MHGANMKKIKTVGFKCINKLRERKHGYLARIEITSVIVEK